MKQESRRGRAFLTGWHMAHIGMLSAFAGAFVFAFGEWSPATFVASVVLTVAGGAVGFYTPKLRQLPSVSNTHNVAIPNATIDRNVNS